MNSIPFNFIELDAETRAHMQTELDFDLNSSGGPYYGEVLTDRGRADYLGLLRASIKTGTEGHLTAGLEINGRVAPNPAGAAKRLAITEFNRYYIRAICRRANAHNTNMVVVYRAYGSSRPRPGSQQFEGTEQFAPRILASIRGSKGQDSETGLGRVNSGITARCGCDMCRRVKA